MSTDFEPLSDGLDEWSDVFAISAESFTPCNVSLIVLVATSCDDALVFIEALCGLEISIDGDDDDDDDDDDDSVGNVEEIYFNGADVKIGDGICDNGEEDDGDNVGVGNGNDVDNDDGGGDGSCDGGDDGVIVEDLSVVSFCPRELGWRIDCNIVSSSVCVGACDGLYI